MNISITQDNYEQLDTFKEILKKDESAMINEALEVYFQAQHKILLEKNVNDESTLTNLGFDEFWEDVDI